ncbi:hypothetical protein V1291_001935 [Nitrobacteraceae bacterium AZCC 1564]
MTRKQAGIVELNHRVLFVRSRSRFGIARTDGLFPTRVCFSCHARLEINALELDFCAHENRRAGNGLALKKAAVNVCKFRFPVAKGPGNCKSIIQHARPE